MSLINQAWSAISQNSYMGTATALFDANKRPDLVEEIAVSSNFAPAVRLAYPLRTKTKTTSSGGQVVTTVEPAASSEPWSTRMALRLLQPRVTIQVKGLPQMSIAPYGHPDPERWKRYALGAVIGGSVVLALAIRGTFVKCPKTP